MPGRSRRAPHDHDEHPRHRRPDGALEEAAEEGGLSTDDILDRLLPLFRSVAAAHDAGLVVDLEGLISVRVDADGTWTLAGDSLKRPVVAHADLVRIGDRGDALRDVFVLGSLLASLACGLDLTDPDDHDSFVENREHLTRLAPAVHPAIHRRQSWPVLAPTRDSLGLDGPREGTQGSDQGDQ